MEDRSKDKYIHKTSMIIYTNSYVEHVCHSGATLWDSGKEGKGKRDRASIIL
jgi:hypothetical protein